MASTQEICRQVLERVDDCLAVGVVDLNTGMLMGVHHRVPYFTQAYLDAVAAAAVEVFRGKNVQRIEELLSDQHGAPLKDTFEEIFISSAKVFHFMAVVKEKSAVVVMVTKRSISQGLGWAALRSSLSPLASTLP